VGKVEREAQPRAAQAGGLDDQLQQRAEEDAHCQAIAVEPTVQQRCGDDDTQVIYGCTESRVAEQLEA